MIEEMLKSQEKIAARKQLYFSIAQLYLSQVCHLKAFLEAEPHMFEDPENKTEEEKRLMLSRGSELMLPLYRFAVGMKGYKAAFGEWPELAKFMEGMLTPDAKGQLESVFDNAIRTINLVEEKAIKSGNKTRPLHKMAFGDQFVTLCNEVKLKGEK